MSDATERDVRCALAAAYRLVALFGWDDLISTHISAKLPGRETFLLNRRDQLFDEITASSLVEIDLDGRVISPRDATVNAAGFMIHSAIHGAHPDVGCVIHLHARSGTAVSMLACGLVPASQKSLLFHGRLAYHAYEGIVLDPGERVRLVANLGDKRAMILRNHGTLAIGQNVPEAFAVIYALETACQLQILAQSTQQPLVEPNEVARARVAEQSRDFSAFMRKYGETAWPGLLRRLARESPGHAE
jgi:ribulose-5-phosphate 4-epimerase/fuculose-1-phosphate aldolase